MAVSMTSATAKRKGLYSTLHTIHTYSRCTPTQCWVLAHAQQDHLEGLVPENLHVWVRTHPGPCHHLSLSRKVLLCTQRDAAQRVCTRECGGARPRPGRRSVQAFIVQLSLHRRNARRHMGLRVQISPSSVLHLQVLSRLITVYLPYLSSRPPCMSRRWYKWVSGREESW